MTPKAAPQQDALRDHQPLAPEKRPGTGFQSRNVRQDGRVKPEQTKDV